LKKDHWTLTSLGLLWFGPPTVGGGPRQRHAETGHLGGGKTEKRTIRGPELLCFNHGPTGGRKEGMSIFSPFFFSAGCFVF